MEQFSDDPQNLLAAPGQISGLGTAREGGASPKIRLMNRNFPGRCDFHLTIDEAHALAAALRQFSQGGLPNEAIGPIRIGYTRFSSSGRVVATIFVSAFPGDFRINVGADDAQRIAGELDQSIQHAQTP